MDICYKIGNCAISHKQYDVSMKWLERALRACESIRHMQQASILSNKDKELLILHASGRVLLVDDKVKFVHKE